MQFIDRDIKYLLLLQATLTDIGSSSGLLIDYPLRGIEEWFSHFSILKSRKKQGSSWAQMSKGLDAEVYLPQDSSWVSMRMCVRTHVCVCEEGGGDVTSGRWRYLG